MEEWILIKVMLIGPPNVGKSVIFNYLTSQYVTVSNYPGTTVDIARGYCKIKGAGYEIIDTPGIYSLLPITEEEEVTRRLFATEKPDLILQVIDGKNISRMLPLSLQLIDAGFPLILIINLLDEAKQYGVSINVTLLADLLGIPVIGTSATKKQGLGMVKQAMGEYKKPESPFQLKYSAAIEESINNIIPKLTEDYGISPRMMALFLLQGDTIAKDSVSKEALQGEIQEEVKKLAANFEYKVEYVLTLERQIIVDTICKAILIVKSTYRGGLAEKLGRLTREPSTGIPILGVVLFLGLYEFVGKFGAGFLVDYIDKTIFAQYIQPAVEGGVYQYIPWTWLQSLVIGNYGIFSLGFRYAFVIILPIVGTFFLLFSILEDSGYLPRMAMLVDKVFKYLGLNGRAAIPFALGFGCGTMAVMVTRTLETRRERMLATFLLSLSIPCSAQLGVILALLSNFPFALILWGMYVGAIFLVIGWLSGKILWGTASPFYMEIPPLRLPQLQNIISKATIRMWWYFIEILPVFILTSILLWWGDRSGLLADIIKGMEPVMLLLGLPPEVAQTFLLGFFRRDYGAAGLYDLCASNLLTKEQLLIASVSLTLFVPCIAQVAVMVKERGIGIATIMITLIIGIAFLAGGLLHWILLFF